MTKMPCVVCGEPADEFTLHYSGDPWDGTPPYKVALCRECQNGMIAVVKAAVKRMKEERDAQVSA